jgi:hypothetical protein
MKRMVLRNQIRNPMIVIAFEAVIIPMIKTMNERIIM